MGGRGGSSGSKGGGGGGGIKAEQNTTTQQATNAKAIENMNEAQLDNEIAKQQKIIANADKVMGNTPKSENIGVIPLGQLTRGKTQAQKDKIIERSTNQAKKFTEAYDKKKMAETKLKNLQKAKKEISGTEKTQKDLRNEKKKQAAKKSGDWKSTRTKEGTTYSQGENTITKQKGSSLFWLNGKYYFNLLSDAKAAAKVLQSRKKGK